MPYDQISMTISVTNPRALTNLFQNPVKQKSSLSVDSHVIPQS